MEEDVAAANGRKNVDLLAVWAPQCWWYDGSPRQIADVVVAALPIDLPEIAKVK